MKPTKCVHIKASWHQATRTCRQVYVESRPSFFASKSYYFGKHQEAAPFFNCFPFGPTKFLRSDTITELCLRDFVETRPLYSKQRINAILSDPNHPRSVNTRQQLEMETFKYLNTRTLYCFGIFFRNLRTFSLCFYVGEEMPYVNLLYCLSDMRRGLVKYVDRSHWLIRPQNPEDTWSIQYACFTGADYGKGKDNEDIPYRRRYIELDVTDINSRAPEVQEGDERSVEVQICRPVVDIAAQKPLVSDEGDKNQEHLSGHSDENLHNQDSHEAQLELFQDQAGNNTLTEISENDDESAGLDTSRNGTDQSFFLWLDSEGSLESQRVTATDQEEINALLQPSSEEVSGIQAGTQYNHQTQHPPLSDSSVLIVHATTVATVNDLPVPLDTGNEDDHAQTEPGNSDGTAHAEDLQHKDTAPAQSTIEVDQVQQDLVDGLESQGHCSKITYLSSGRPLLNISDTPNPYTEEEMESYESWQELSISGKRKKTVEYIHPEDDKFSSSFGKMREHPGKPSCTPRKTSDPQQEAGEDPTATSQDPPGLLVRSIQAGVLFLLYLIHALITYHPDRLSNTSQDSSSSGSQH